MSAATQPMAVVPGLPEHCGHCGLELAAGQERFCGGGCARAFELLRAQGLERFYDLRDGSGRSINDEPRKSPKRWLQAAEDRLASAQAGPVLITARVAGMHCAGCGWVIEALARNHAGGLPVELGLNPTTGKCDLRLPAGFGLAGWTEDLRQLGYTLSHWDPKAAKPSGELLFRTAACLALAGNVMLLSYAHYLGLSGGPVHLWTSRAILALTLVSVWVGAVPIWKQTWQHARRGLFHFELPAAIGLGLASVGVAVQYLATGTVPEYLDGLCVFIALSLLGKYVFERGLQMHGVRALAAGPVQLPELLVANPGGGFELRPCHEVEAGEALLLRRGDVVPVAAELRSENGRFSLEWITGEPKPRLFTKRQMLQAGAFYQGAQPVELLAEEDYATSDLKDLLEGSLAPASPATSGTSTFARLYVMGALAAGVFTFLGCLVWGLSLEQAFVRTVAVWVVSCPCSIALSLPLAQERGVRTLAQLGVLVRNGSLFRKLESITAIAFDKTGTLTTGRIELEDEGALSALPATDLAALRQLVAHNPHPKAQAVARALPQADDARLSLPVWKESLGQGVEANLAAGVYRLGRSEWCVGEQRSGLCFSKDGQVLALLTFREELRPDCAAAVRNFAQTGLSVAILSGDEPAAVQRLAEELSLPPEQALGGLLPAEKAQWIEAQGAESTLMFGDGLNDSPALGLAAVSGTPAVLRPYVVSHCDFYLQSQRLQGLSEMFRIQGLVVRAARAAAGFGALYNLTAVVLAATGVLRPWMAAVAMPLSSLFSVLIVNLSFERTKRWKLCCCCSLSAQCSSASAFGRSGGP